MASLVLGISQVLSLHCAGVAWALVDPCRGFCATLSPRIVANHAFAFFRVESVAAQPECDHLMSMSLYPAARTMDVAMAICRAHCAHPCIAFIDRNWVSDTHTGGNAECCGRSPSLARTRTQVVGTRCCAQCGCNVWQGACPLDRPARVQAMMQRAGIIALKQRARSLTRRLLADVACLVAFHWRSLPVDAAHADHPSLAACPFKDTTRHI